MATGGEGVEGAACRVCGRPVPGEGAGEERMCAGCLIDWVGETLATDELATVSTGDHSPGNESRSLAGRVPAVRADGIGRIGGYELIEVLGEGGFARVYLARQSVPVRRTVAVKVLKGGHGGAWVADRFALERQALASMDHPNVCKVFDAGTTDDGSPFFVMEAVDGVPITEFCRGRRLDLNAVLAVFRDACSAVHHAHQRGIIHRDLKPSNMLVAEKNERPHPMVIDFGIAKAIEPILDEDIELTGEFQVIGTPAYMSPEQVRLGAREADVRSDVYSLGAVLYELITGSTPVPIEQLRGRSAQEALRIVTESRPRRPSATLAKVARADLPASGQAGVARDLDWLVMKAIDPDRERRYQSVAALVDDLAAFEACRPVSAGPPGVRYRTRKFVERHRRGVAAVMVATAATAIGLAIRDARLDREAGRELADLLETPTASVPFAASSLRPHLGRLRPTLSRIVSDDASSLGHRVNAAIVLSGLTPSVSSRLGEWLVHETEIGVSDLRAIQTAVDASGLDRALLDRAWALCESPMGTESKRLRAAALLAVADPGSERWSGVAGDLAFFAAAGGATEANLWAELLAPVGVRLEGPLLSVFESHQERPAGVGAAAILARFASRNAAKLTSLVAMAGPGQSAVLLDAIAAHGGDAREILEEVLAQPIDETSGEVARDAEARVRVRAGLSLVRLGAGDAVWPRLARLGTWGDPRLRYYLLHGMAEFGVSPIELIEHLGIETDESVKAALILALGDYDENALPAELRDLALPHLEEAVRSPDAEEHAAASWLLHSWDMATIADRVLADLDAAGFHGDDRAAPFTWHRNVLGMTMVRIGAPGTFEMGSPGDEPGRGKDEDLRSVSIDHHFAISARLMTNAQARELLPERRQIGSPAPGCDGEECPVHGISLAEARILCNHLSARDGIPESEWAYTSDDPPAPKPDHVQLAGYRVPSEAEWEFACRAFSRATRPYGFDESLAGKYAWFAESAEGANPPGRLRPNAFGLLDTLGNLREWIDDPYDLPTDRSSPLTGFQRFMVPRGSSALLQRGGFFGSEVSELRSAGRHRDIVGERENSSYTGLRVARTLTGREFP